MAYFPSSYGRFLDLLLPLDAYFSSKNSSSLLELSGTRGTKTSKSECLKNTLFFKGIRCSKVQPLWENNNSDSAFKNKPSIIFT